MYRKNSNYELFNSLMNKVNNGLFFNENFFRCKSKSFSFVELDSADLKSYLIFL